MSSRKDQRFYDPEFKKEAVRLVIEKNRGCFDIASSLGIPKGTLSLIHLFQNIREPALYFFVS
jgi:transposase-like protein